MSAALAQKHDADKLPEGHWIDDEGYQVDADGEVVAFVGKPAAIAGPFVVDDREKAEWVLSKLADAEAQAQAIDRRRVILIANMTRQLKKAEARIASLHRRFGFELAIWAKRVLAGKKARSIQLDNGRIAFRDTKGSNEIKDMAKAVAWMRANGYGDDVKVVETVTITSVAAAVAAEFRDGTDNSADVKAALAAELASFLVSTGPRESCTITADLRS